MKTKIVLISTLFMSLLSFPTSHANVDVTNSFDFKYECTPAGGILHTFFDLGGHHLYSRDYKINLPGILQIADSAHTTTSKDLNVSIPGCKYTPNCQVQNWSAWTLSSSGNTSHTFSINTTLPIGKNGNDLSIQGKGNNKDILITGFSGSYNGKGKDIQLVFGEDKIVLKENGDEIQTYTFTNKKIYPSPEYYYEFSPNIKTIKLQRNTFTRNGTGTAKSSNNSYDTFAAFGGTNTASEGFDDAGLDPNPNAQGPDFITGLNYWDYTQHHYTTTKVDLYPVSFPCDSTELSNGSTLTHGSFTGTLGTITDPSFSGPISINKVEQDTSSISMYAASGVHLTGLNYATVGEIGGKKIGIDGIEFTIKKGVDTLGKQKVNFPVQSSVGEFPPLDFNQLKDASGKAFTLTKPDTYGLQILMYSGEQLIGTYALPIRVIPNNDLKIDTFTLSGSGKYANNTDAYQICSSAIHDSFGNAIDTTGDFGDNLQVGIQSEGFDIDLVTSGFQGEGLTVNNKKFESDSKFCFDIQSVVPGAKTVSFDIQLPKHDLSNQIISEYASLPFESPISFKKPFIGALSVITSPYSLLLGTTLTTQLSVTKKSTISNYTIESFKDQLQSTITEHKISGIANMLSPTSNPTIDYRIETTTDSGVNKTPAIVIKGNPIITYTLSGTPVRYRLSASDDPTYTTELTLGGTTTSGLKVVGGLQGQGKQSVAGQKVNFSDISKSDMRTIIRKNAYTLTRGRTSSETVIGDIKYHEGDYKLSGTPSYETLIVKNGNLTIASNFNTTGKKFGIIVLRDDSTDMKTGNIYIYPSVQYIQAAIYADGSIISSGFGDNDTVGGYQDSAQRTNTLSGQLVINGTLFTRNTIGGAILGDSQKYILPGGSSTTDFDLALMYDLNLLRRGNKGHDVHGTNGTADYNKGNTENVVIISNPDLVKNPPKGFKN